RSSTTRSFISNSATIKPSTMPLRTSSNGWRRAHKANTNCHAATFRSRRIPHITFRTPRCAGLSPTILSESGATVRPRTRSSRTRPHFVGMSQKKTSEVTCCGGAKETLMPSYDPNNVFAKILRGELPSHKVYEDEHTFAFLDIMPRAPGHTLIIPKSPAR